jgi:hypothetical protein
MEPVLMGLVATSSKDTSSICMVHAKISVLEDDLLHICYWHPSGGCLSQEVCNSILDRSRDLISEVLPVALVVILFDGQGVLIPGDLILGYCIALLDELLQDHHYVLRIDRGEGFIQFASIEVITNLGRLIHLIEFLEGLKDYISCDICVMSLLIILAAADLRVIEDDVIFL